MGEDALCLYRGDYDEPYATDFNQEDAEINCESRELRPLRAAHSKVRLLTAWSR